MKVYIDISIFTETLAIGSVNGELELQEIPRVGDTITFMVPTNKNILPLSGLEFDTLMVEHVTFWPLPCVAGSVSLTLKDLMLDTPEDGLKVAKYLEKGFSLNFDNLLED